MVLVRLSMRGASSCSRCYFVEIFDAPTDGEWDGRYGAISDLVRYHEVPAGSHKIFEGKVHALYCMLSHGALSLLTATDTLQSMD